MSPDWPQHQEASGIWIVAARVRGWLARRHSLPAEAAVVLALYLAYEGGRGLVGSDTGAAVEHARAIASLERALHLFVERGVQDAALAVPGLAGALGLAYLSLHLTVTGGLLVWLHQRRPAAFPLVRTALLLASGLALVGFVVFPTAPPRLAAMGIADTVSGRHINLNRGLVSALYNPYAAVPSMHIGYALVVGASLLRYGRRRALRLIGATYPLFVLLVVVATGNHFLLDAFAGALVAALAAAAAVLVARPIAEVGSTSGHARSHPYLGQGAHRCRRATVQVIVSRRRKEVMGGA